MLFLSVSGQNIAEQIKPINTIEEANIFVEVHKNLGSEIWNLTPEFEKDEINKLFNEKNIGEIFSDNENTYKIIDSKK